MKQFLTYNNIRTTHPLGSLALMLACSLTLLLTSCSEHEAAGEYDNWQERNQHYIDSIYHAATANADGTWLCLKAYNIGEDESLYLDQPNQFVYAKKLQTGTGTVSPLYNDSVRVHYSGRLIPTNMYPDGYNFGKSYSTSILNPDTDVPTLLAVKDNVVGFITALLNMHEGDRWMVYIPHDLGYGKSEYTSATIPAYSTLIFDIQLARVYRFKVDTDTSWH